MVKRAERTFVIDVDVTSRDPMKAVRLANAVAQAISRNRRKCDPMRPAGVAVVVVAPERAQGTRARFRATGREL